MHFTRIALVIVHTLIEEPRLRETLLQIAVDNCISILNQFCTLICFSIFQSIEGIQQCATYKTDFCHRTTLTSSRKQAFARKVIGSIATYITLHKEITHHLFHLILRIGRFYRLWFISVIAILPSPLYKLRKILTFIVAKFPHKGDTLPFSQFLKSLYGRCQRKFTDVCFGSFPERESESEIRDTTYILETRISD